MRRWFIIASTVLFGLLPALAQAGGCVEVGLVHKPTALEPCEHAASVNLDAFRAAHPALYQKYVSSRDRRANILSYCDCYLVALPIVTANTVVSPPNDDESTPLPVAVWPSRLDAPGDEQNLRPTYEIVVLSVTSPLYLTTARLRI